MFIIEGPDGAGKTTLIQSIRKAFPDLPMAERAMSSDIKPLKGMKEYIEEWTNKQHFSDVLFDRFALISGPLYAPILNDGYQLNIYNNRAWMAQRYMMFYGSVRPVLIWCLPPLSVVRDNIRNDPDNAKAAPYIERIYQAYVARAALDVGYPRSYIYDYTQIYQVGKPTELDRILAHIETRRNTK